MDILSPVLGFNFGLTNSQIQYNYARIALFSRNYFIKNWEWRDGLWWAYMQVDALASFKTQIGNSSCFILRSASEFTREVPDYFYSTLPEPMVALTNIQKPWTATSFSSGTYVVGVLCKDGSAGAVSYYALSPAQFKSFRNAMLSDSGPISDITDISTDLAKSLVNPFQYIVSAVWFPFTISNGTSTTLNFGWYETDIQALALSRLYSDVYLDFTVSAHPYAVTQGAGYRFSESNSRYIVFIPPFGEIELDAGIMARLLISQVGYSTQLQAHIYVDLVTGNAYLEIYGAFSVSDEVVLVYREGKVGVPAQLGQITADVAGGIQSVISGLGSVANNLMGGNIIGAITAGANAGLDAVQKIQPKAITSGSNGTASVYELTPYVQVIYYPHVEQSPEEYGRPLYKTKTINTLSGFTKTLNADISISGATIREQEEIKAYMDGGFFYE